MTASPAPVMPPAQHLAQLFPDAVHTGVADVDEQAVTRLPAQLAASLPPYASTARQAAFAAGRLAAAEALLACTGTRHWVTAAANGAPAWPPGTRGSLSHSADVAVCVVTRARSRLGVDIEPLTSAPGLYRARRYFCSSTEAALVAATDEPELAALRLFCAKEACYKALPPARQAGLTLRSLQLVWCAPRDSASFLLPDPSGTRSAVQIRYAVLRGHLAAAATMPLPLRGTTAVRSPKPGRRER